jgi:hypothetical protein
LDNVVVAGTGVIVPGHLLISDHGFESGIVKFLVSPWREWKVGLEAGHILLERIEEIGPDTVIHLPETAPMNGITQAVFTRRF